MSTITRKHFDGLQGDAFAISIDGSAGRLPRTVLAKTPRSQNTPHKSCKS